MNKLKMEGKYGFDDFPKGKRVQINKCMEDFIFFDGSETGTVLENTGEYLGVKVKLDFTLRIQSRSNLTSHDYTTWGFNPKNLTPLKRKKS